MSDYWVSRDKYFCKYCKIYISDDKPSRTHHETGLRHKGNYERYIRDIYKKGITEKKEAREEKAEIARIEAAAAAAMGLPAPSSSEPSTSTKPKPKPSAASSSTSSADPYANYTTAASLGLKDEHAEKQNAEAEQRQKEGVIGQWERVVKPRAPAPKPAVPTGGFAPVGGVKKEDNEEEEEKPDLLREGQGDGRTLGGEEDDHPVDVAKKRGFLTEKSASGLYFDDEDDALASLNPIKLKKRRLTVKEQRQLEVEAEEEARRKEEAEREAERRGARVGSGWEAADMSRDGEFDPLAGMGAGEEKEGGEGGEEQKPEVKAEEVEEEKPKVQSGFKKRKMHGAGLARKR
ncbi:hypothetical protein JCM8547_003178 [Rhodosporidiobolus lusitaniae]